MIRCLFLFFTSSLFGSKPDLFISLKLQLMLDYVPMILVLPLVLFIINLSSFNTSLNFESLAFKLIVLSICILLSLCFFLGSPFLFLLCLECCVALMFFWMLNWSKDLDKVTSIMHMFFFNIFGSLPFLLYSSTMQTFGFLECFLPFFFEGFCSVLFFFCFRSLLLFKVPIFLSHFWLTKAHVSASGPISMVLARIILKLGTIGLLKFFSFFEKLSFFFFPLFFSLRILRSLIFCLLILRSFDLKFLVASSSVLHMSIIRPCIFSLVSVELYSSLLMIVGHGLVSYVLFFLLTLLYEINSRRSSDLGSSTERRRKTLTMWLLVFFLLNLGFPPFINFLREALFCCLFWVVSPFSLIYFFFIFLGALFFTVILVFKFLFRKKVINLDKTLNLIPLVSLNWFFLILVFIPLVVYYFFSLIKILHCGGKDIKSFGFKKTPLFLCFC